MKSFNFQSPHVILSETSNNRKDQETSGRIISTFGLAPLPPSPPGPEGSIIESVTLTGTTANVDGVTLDYTLSREDGVNIEIEWRFYFGD